MTPTTLLWLVTGCLMLQPLSTDLYLATLPGMAKDFCELLPIKLSETAPVSC